jgi:cytochrome c oxidase cbb3-type subunit 3
MPCPPKNGMLNGLSVVLLAFIVAFAHSELPSPQAQQRHVRKQASYEPAMVEAGAKLFVGSCSVCHGIDGKGGARGPDLTQGLVVNRGGDEEVAQVIRKGVPGSSMAAFDLPDLQIRQLVAFIRSLSTTASQLSVPGDADAGKQVFFVKAHCSDCHMIRGQGGLLGPELSNLGNERTLLEIRESILKPGSMPHQGYRAATVVTAAGEEITGVVQNRDSFSLQMIDKEGRLRFFLIPELRKIEIREKSLMPDNYQTLLLPKELQDLLAYLSRQTVVPGGEIDQRKEAK